MFARTGDVTTGILAASLVCLVGLTSSGGSAANTGIRQSNVIVVTAEAPFVTAQSYSMMPLPVGKAPALTAEAVRQVLMSHDANLRLLLGDPSKLKVWLGLWRPSASSTPDYLFFAGPLVASDCHPSGAGPIWFAACYALLAASAQDASVVGGLYSSNSPVP
ncbi:MAG: hypothetical protein ACRDQZ_06855 [Mycobacteriales bacterium]